MKFTPQAATFTTALLDFGLGIGRSTSERFRPAGLLYCEWLSLCLLTLIGESKIRNLAPGAAGSSLGILPMH
jgi:hypothetical protein